jgi:hypothetical protein
MAPDSSTRPQVVFHRADRSRSDSTDCLSGERRRHIARSLFNPETHPGWDIAVASLIDGAWLGGGAALSLKEVRKYYAGDKVIWSVFRGFRRFDRWVKTRIAGRR